LSASVVVADLCSGVPKGVAGWMPLVAVFSVPVPQLWQTYPKSYGSDNEP
jgi:hypothetical protein